MPKVKTDSVYQIKVTLKNVTPPVSRLIEVRGSTNLFELHVVLQRVMGWEDYHLHQFLIDGKKYSHHDYEPQGYEDTTIDEGKIRLSEVVPQEGTQFVYEYDFGDGWEHELSVEKISPSEKGVSYPRCVAGKRACPPEDCGGPGGYEDLLEAIKSSEHPQHEELLEWIGGRFDSEEFDIDKVNKLLKKKVS